MTPYPEHEKLEAKKLESQVLSAFLDWWDTREWEICLDGTGPDGLSCYYEVPKTKEEIIGLFLDIDPKVLETEKQEMLDAIRKKINE